MLKISENIEIEHVFQFKAFFHITSNLHTSCFSAFKDNPKFNMKNHELEKSPIIFDALINQIKEHFIYFIYSLFIVDYNRILTCIQ